MNGKGSRPRNNFSKKFRNNYDEINWGNGKLPQIVRCKKGHEVFLGTCYECKLEPGECGCRKCNPYANWFIVCEKCGNKRCPHATNHELNCTNSNALGQKGSVFE